MTKQKTITSKLDKADQQKEKCSREGIKIRDPLISRICKNRINEETGAASVGVLREPW